MALPPHKQVGYVNPIGYLNGRRIGTYKSMGYTKDVDKEDSKVIWEDSVSLLAVDGFRVEVKVGYEHNRNTTLKTFKIPVADLRFFVEKDGRKQIVSSIRLTNHQIQDLLKTLQDKLDDFNTND